MNLEDAYAAAHAEALALVERLSDYLYDLPAPDTDGLNWGHVGDLSKIADQLKQILGDAE